MTDETLGSRSARDEKHEDLPLAVAAPDLDEPEIEDVPVDLSEEDFDFGDFVEGSRPTRHAVRPAMRGDLLAVMETIVMEVEDAEKRGDTDTVNEKVAEYDEVKAEFEASRRRIVVEARSTMRRQQLTKQLEKQGLTRPPKKASEEAHTKYAQELLLHRLADQIVHPTRGVTVDALRKLLETNEPALDLIYQAAEKANSTPAKALTPDFSRGR